MITSADNVKVTGVYLEENFEAIKPWSLPLNLARCQRLTPGGHQKGNEMDDILRVLPARDLAVTTRSKFKLSEQCASAMNKAKWEFFKFRSTISCRKPDVV